MPKKPFLISRSTLIGILIVLAAGIVLTVFLYQTAQSPDPKSKPPGTGSQPIRPESRQVAPKSLEAPGQLVISASVDTGSKVLTARPLIISASLWRKALLPDSQGNLPVVAPLVIKAKTGSWQEALTVEIRDAAGNLLSWPLHPMNPADSTLTLRIEDTVQAYWFLEPSETESLSPGLCTISVSFNPDKVEGLPAYVASDRFHLTIEKEAPGKVSETEKILQTARFALFKKDMKAAHATVDQVLTQDPENLDGLSLKASLLSEEGKKQEALTTLNNALMVYYRKFPDAEPPLNLIQQRTELMKDIAPEGAPGQEDSPPTD